MEDTFKDSLLKVSRLLEKFKIQYLLVGGTAVALNGYYRQSRGANEEIVDKPDIDVWYNPTYENYFNVLKVIEELGQNIAEFKNEQAPDPLNSFFRLEFDDFTLDMLPKIKANIKFFEASKRKETVEIQETQIHFMSYYDLIEDKKATARQKDLDDLDHLKRIQGEE